MSEPISLFPFTKIHYKKAYPSIDPTQASVSVAGKTVVITAGHTGIGYAIAQNFAIAGASHVILVARREELLASACKELSASNLKTQFHYFTASIADDTALKNAFVDIRKIAEPDILIASAAYVGKSSTAMDLTAEEFQASFATNVLGNMALVHEFFGKLDSGKEKVVINLSSMATHIDFPYLAAYGITKLAFTQWLAKIQDGEKEGRFRVYNMHPGSVLTDAVRGFGLDETSHDWDDAQLPGQFAVWLASEEGEFLKGRLVWANWDVDELKARKGDFEADPALLKISLLGKPKIAG
jgi:NAD(P)-dependent dehydrogenase (short-subunit alcohol dehydrogenase family)